MNFTNMTWFKDTFAGSGGGLEAIVVFLIGMMFGAFIVYIIRKFRKGSQAELDEPVLSELKGIMHAGMTDIQKGYSTLDRLYNIISKAEQLKGGKE